MAKLKKTPKQAMKLWLVAYRGRGIRVRARTARTAARKFLRGNIRHAVAVCEYELDNPGNPDYGPGAVAEVLRSRNRQIKRWASRVSIEDIRVESA